MWSPGLTFFFTLCVFSATLLLAHSNTRLKRAWIIDSFSIEEENPGPFPYLLGKINVEQKYRVFFNLHGSGVDEEPIGVLSIDHTDGSVLVHKKVDHETHQMLKLTFETTNVSNSKVDMRLGVEIKIMDINDHAPVFKPPHYTTTVEESTAQGQVVATVVATDLDDPQTPNGTFSFRIASITPETDNVKFFLEPPGTATVGKIYFRGCLDYEKAQKYLILVEAKDNGEKVRLSSTSSVVVNIMDKNNHLPEITGQTGPGRIKERESGVEVLRLQLKDLDSPGSDAWKAKYTIHGDEEKYFKIETDPKTNEGILTVTKAMDYEEQSSRNISISVANVAPYFSCEVTRRPKEGLWDVKTFTEGPGTKLPISPKLYPVTIAVEDVNDPPEFVPPVRIKGIMENTEVGTHLCTLTAKDPDKTFASEFRFIKGEDPDNWITVDSKTGEVFTAKVIDRESTFVKDNSYSIVLYVVDNGEPPMTGTGTLIIQVSDQNDNLPQLEKTLLSMCLSDKTTNITAVDLDLPPFSYPFTYELLGDVKGKWTIDPTHGTTVNLVKEDAVYSGIYNLQVKVADNQGLSLTQNISVTVCDCSTTPNCHERRSSGAQMGNGAIGIMFFTLLLLLAILLMIFLISCKHEIKMIPTDDGPSSHLLASNTETLGSDCKVPGKITQVDSIKSTLKGNISDVPAYNVTSKHEIMHENIYGDAFQNEEILRRSMRQSFSRHSRRSHATLKESSRYSTYNVDIFHLRQDLITQLNQNLIKIQVPGEELGDYEPHCYAYEGEPMMDPQLDAICIPGTEFHPDILTDLGPRFKKLASICRPDLM